MRKFKRWMANGMTVKAGRYPVATILSSDIIRCSTNGSLWVNGFTVLLEDGLKEVKVTDGGIFHPICSLSYERQTFNDVMLSNKKSINVRFQSSLHFRTLKISHSLSSGFSIHGKIDGHDLSFRFNKPEDLARFPYMTLNDIDAGEEQNAEIHNSTRQLHGLAFEMFLTKRIDLNNDEKEVSDAG